jgi:hypothetical protein
MYFLGLALAAAAGTSFGPAQAWTVGFTDSSQIPLFADVNGDGNADLITVNPADEGSIDVDLTVEGIKPGGASRALDKWGKGCAGAVAGTLPGTSKAVVIGLFNGQTLNLASNYSEGKFTLAPRWVVLPSPLPHPSLALLDQGKTVLAFSRDTGDAYMVDTLSKTSTAAHVPKGFVWIGDCGDHLAGQRSSGEVDWINKSNHRVLGKVGMNPKGSRPAAFLGGVAFADHAWTRAGSTPLTPTPFARADAIWQVGPSTRGGQILVEFRAGNDLRRGDLVLARCQTGSESSFQDSSNDGLLDDWKLNGYRGLDLKGLGCTVGHADVICLISRFDDVAKDRLQSEISRVVKFYADLPCDNPDGTKGIRFHPIYLDPIAGDDKKNSWQTNRDKFLPSKWRGVVHWMQVTPGGGGQADELSNGGTCGQNALWAVFVHEFGHQLGLNHEGFWPVNGSPVYTSLMNYTWSYGFEESRDKIHYSDGRFLNLVLHENDLDETLPYPYAKVKFLSEAPYHFRMQPKGDQTLIDWNWDGVFGEKHVRANITYSYSVSAGTRDNVGKTKTAPWIFTHGKKAFVLFGANDKPVDLSRQPTLDASNPGRLVLKRMESPTHWSPEWIIDANGLIGDPVAVSYKGAILCCYPTQGGLMLRKITVAEKGIATSPPLTVSKDPSLVPSMGVYEGKCMLFDWNPRTDEVGYRLVTAGTLGERHLLDVSSTNPVGFCTDSVDGALVLGLAQDQDKDRTHRWQVRKYRLAKNGLLDPVGAPDWIGGVDGGSRSTGRLTLLFDGGRDAGPKGRIFLFGKGMTDEKTPWACSYVAETIADKTYQGGWLVKRYYDEWSQTRSAPAAAWFDKDILFAYRWTDGGQGATDNDFHLGYHGLGIFPEEMGDFDDIGYIRTFGLANSLPDLTPFGSGN